MSLSVVVAIVAAGPVGARGAKPPVIKDGPVVQVQLLALNDFHGNMEPPTGSSGRVGSINAGGAEYLATHVANLEATNANTLVVSAGDLIGASPLLSALFHDEPTIEAMNDIGLDLNAVGNHEFDEGTTELTRMAEGGCHPVDGCQDGTGFAGADFEFLAANVVNHESGEPLFAPYVIRNFNGARIAFIGMTLEGTPTIVSPSGVAGFDFLDEADTVNALVPEIRQRGVEAIIVLLHEGGTPNPLNPPPLNSCPGLTGPIIDIVNRMDDEVDMVISGHTHQPYSCMIDGRPVTSAFSFGRVLTKIDVRVDRSTQDVQSIAIDNRIVNRDVARDAEITALIDRYRVLAAPIANRVIGHITADILRAQDLSRESSLGNVIADAQLAATTSEGAVAAFMNPGGVRTDLIYSASAGGEPAGAVTYGEAFAVQPFGNSLVTMDVTGSTIDAMLEQQFCGPNASSTTIKVLSPSAGVHYTYSQGAVGAGSCATANAVDIASITINGVPINPAATYRITVNSFLADGGDNFTALVSGTNRVGGAVDTDAFEAYLQTKEPAGLSPAPTDRIDIVA